MSGTNIRLYESALNDVRYVYGAPVKFSTDRAILEARDADLARKIAEERTREENARKREAEAKLKAAAS